MKIIIGLLGVMCLTGISETRPKSLVHPFKGKVYGIFDPNSKIYFSGKETISKDDIEDTLFFLESLKNNTLLRKSCMRADPSLAALIDDIGVYSALATRYRYEPLMKGKIPEQEPPSWDIFSNYVRSKSQGSAFAKAVRNRFRSIENLSAKLVTMAIQEHREGASPFTVGNLGGAAGDDISVGVARATVGKGTTKVRQFLYDIDSNAMKLGEELANKIYRYEVRAMGDMNIIDLERLPVISEHLRKENVKWINSIGFFMEYEVEKSNGLHMSHADKQKILEAYCKGGVEHITFSAYQDHPLPRFVVEAGWKKFELTWTPSLITEALSKAGYKLVSMDSGHLPLMQVYYFKGDCK